MDIVETFDRLGLERVRLLKSTIAGRYHLVLDTRKGTEGPVLSPEETVTDPYDPAAFPMISEGSMPESEIEAILSALPDGCGDLGVQAALIGYGLGYLEGIAEGEAREYQSLMDAGYRAD